MTVSSVAAAPAPVAVGDVVVVMACSSWPRSVGGWGALELAEGEGEDLVERGLEDGLLVLVEHGPHLLVAAADHRADLVEAGPAGVGDGHPDDAAVGVVAAALHVPVALHAVEVADEGGPAHVGEAGDLGLAGARSRRRRRCGTAGCSR